MRHTIVIEIPDGAIGASVESIVTERLNATVVAHGPGDEDGGLDYAPLKVVEYHHEQMTESDRCYDGFSIDERSTLAAGLIDWLSDKYGERGQSMGKDPTDDGWRGPARMLTDLVSLGAEVTPYAHDLVDACWKASR